MSCKKHFSSSSSLNKEKFDLDGHIFRNSKINRMYFNIVNHREENLVNDVCDDDQEGVAKVEQKPFLNRLDGVSAAKTGRT